MKIENSRGFKGWNIVKICTALLMAGTVAGTLLLTLAYLLPVDSGHKDASMAMIDSEGWYPRATVTASSLDAYFHSYLPDVLDDSTDKIMLSTAMDTGKGNPLVRAMNSHSEYMGDYSYYWHGYVSILRPLLLVFDYGEIRMLNGCCQLTLLVLFAFLIGREKGAGYVLMLGTSYLLLNPSAMFLSLQYAWVFYIAFCGALVLVVKRDFFAARSRYVYCFIVIGMLTSYFDLLTYPLYTWGVPLIWWLAMDTAMDGPEGRIASGASVTGSNRGGSGQKCSRAGICLGRVLFSGFAWIAGYAVMWVMKWTVATIVLKRNIFQSALYEVFYRLGAQEEGGTGIGDRLNAVYINWKHYEYKIYAILLGCWLAGWVWCSLRKGFVRSSRRYAYLLAGVSSIAWCLVLANHTQGHHFFTYRIMGVAVLAFLAMILDSTGVGHNMPHRREGGGRADIADSSAADGGRADIADSSAADGGRADIADSSAAAVKKKRILCGWAGAVLLAIPCVLTAREDVVTLNGAASFHTMQISEGAVVEAFFSPAFSKVLEVSLGLECPGTTGEYEIILWEGEIPLYQYTIPIVEGDGYYHNTLVSWKLNYNKMYRVTIQAIHNDAPVSIWVTDSGEAPLTEYKVLTVDGEQVEGQLLSGFHYRGLPVSKKTLLFLALTWTGIWMAVFYTFCIPLWEKHAGGPRRL